MAVVPQELSRPRRPVPPPPAGGGPRRATDLGASFEAAAVPVYRELIRLCGGDRDRAEELRQDTFERAARHLDRHPDRQVGTGWFVTVARSAFIDQIRRDRRDRGCGTASPPWPAGTAWSRAGTRWGRARRWPSSVG